MTVPVPGSLTYTYLEDGVTTVFSYPVRFLEATELVVIREAADGQRSTLVYNTDYTVSGAGNPSGGSITRTAVTDGGKIILTRSTAPKQLVDLKDAQRNPAEAVELQLDRLAMSDQDMRETLKRTLKVRVGEDGDDLELAPVATDGTYDSLFDKPTLGTAAATDASDYATASQGSKADSAVQTITGGVSASVDATDPQNPVINFTGTGTGDMLAANNGSDFSSAPEVRKNIGGPYPSVTSMSGTAVPDGIAAVQVDGYSSAGDGGGGLYRRVLSEPPHVGKFKSADGAWWEKVYDKQPRPMRFETAGDDTALREIVASGGEYRSFPSVAKTKDGRLVCVYWRGNGHSPSIAGDGKGQFDATVSDDGGATWLSPVGVYGNVSNGDPYYSYFQACGSDRYGNVVLVLGIYDGVGAVRPHIMRSEDGVRWSKPVEMTVTGSVDVTAGTLVPFGSIKLLPSGKMIIPVYQGDYNWAGVIDDDISQTTLDLSSLIVQSSSPAYSEHVLCPISEREWLAFLRQDGAVNSIPTRRTLDAGGTWEDLGDTGLPLAGGYLAQDAFPFDIGGMLHVGLIVGVRQTVSLPVAGAPFVMLAVTSYKDMIESGDPQFRRRHVWPLINGDAAVRDAYAGCAFEPITSSLAVVINEEIATAESRILTGALNVGSALNGQPEQVRRSWTPAITGSVVEGTNTYSARRAWYSESGDWVDGYFRMQVSVLGSEGDLTVTGFPIPFAADQELIVQTATGLAAGIERITLRPTENATTAEILERSGFSHLIHTEVSGTLDLRCTFRYRRYLERG